MCELNNVLVCFPTAEPDIFTAVRSGMFLAVHFGCDSDVVAPSCLNGCHYYQFPFKLGDSAVADIQQMLQRDRSIANSRNEHGATPLMYASMRNSPKVTVVGHAAYYWSCSCNT